MRERRPAEWQEKPLLDVVNLPRGQVLPTAEPFRSQVLIAPDHIESKTGRILSLETAASQGAISGKYQIEPGDVLLSKIRPALRKVAYSSVHGLCSADIYPLRTRAEIDPKFLFAVLLGSRFGQFAESLSGRSGIPKINRKELAEFSVALPPPQEQRRIAEILETVDKSIRSTERLVEKLRLARNGLLSDLLGDGTIGCGQPDAGPPSWHTFPLGFLAEIAGGVALGRSLPPHGTIELPYLRVANVQDGYIDKSDVKRVRVLRSEVRRYELQPGDFLMTEGGDFDKLGRGAVWDGSITPCLHQNHIFRVRADKSLLLPDFLAAYAGSPKARRYFVGASKQTTNLATINLSQVRAFPLPVPPLIEQERVVGALALYDERLQILVRELGKLQRVKQGLMEDLLTGRVRVSAEGAVAG